MGLIQIPRYHAAADLGSGNLRADYPPSQTPVSLLYPHNRQLSPRLRVFIDWLACEFATQAVSEAERAARRSGNGEALS